MSEHWKPDANVVPLRPGKARREWARAQAYWNDEVRSRPLPHGAKAGLVLVAAACVGVAVGIYSAFGPRDAIAPEVEAGRSASAEIVLPDVVDDAADAEWAGRAEGGQDSPSTRSGRTAGGALVHFGHCHVGGGTNCVVDGDTFYIGGAKVRIAGIDAPETHPPRCEHEARLGSQATQTLRAMLNSGAVTMTGVGRNRDAYGRLLRNVAVDGQDVGQAMIAAGVAREYVRGRKSWC